MTTRTDVHRPINLVTEDYEYMFAADTNGPWALHLDRGFLAELTNFGPADPHPATNQCTHCGAHLRYVAFLRHTPTGYTITVGEDCLENRFERATREFHRLRKAANLDRKAQRIVNLRNAFVEAHPDLAFMNDPNHNHVNEFVADVARKLRMYGELSERQIDAVRRAIVRDAEWAAKKAAEVEEPKIPVVEGKVRITGEVLTTKWQDSDFGGSLKMLVKDDRGFKVWGTVPRALQVERGDKVAFNATVEASHDDPCFGFFKRPTQAVMVKEVRV